jgi:hypothetical protein
MLAMQAEISRFNWNFNISRGQVVSEILEHTVNADLVAVGRLGRSLARAPIGSTVRCLIEQGKGLTMILQQGRKLVSPVFTVYKGSELSEQALAIATELARAIGGHLEILIPASDEDEFKLLCEQALSGTKTRHQYEKIKLFFRQICMEPAQALERILRSEFNQPIVLPVDVLENDPQKVQKLIKQVNNPILLVR